MSMPGGLSVPGRPDPSGNPLVVLNGNLGALTAAVTAINDTMTKAALPHAATVQATADGNWGVFCLACTAKAHEYVYRCLHWGDGDDPWPPAVLISLPESTEVAGS